VGQQIYGYGPGEHEYSVTVPPMMAGDGEITVYVSAHGGGTVGEAYADNGWDYLVTAGGRTVLEGSDIRSPAGRAAGHEETARSVASFLSAAGESLAHGGEASEYTPEEVAWLISEYERLGLFADSMS
jgi:hypothetical protein